jgi:hypothetical protein
VIWWERFPCIHNLDLVIGMDLRILYVCPYLCPRDVEVRGARMDMDARLKGTKMEGRTVRRALLVESTVTKENSVSDVSR